MKIIPILMMAALIGYALFIGGNDPTPEQKAIVELQTHFLELQDQVTQNYGTLMELTARANKPKPVEAPKPLPFKETYPEVQQTLEGLNTAVNKCVESCTHANIEIASLKDDVAKVVEYQKSCPACEPKSTNPKTQTTITLPTSEYNTAIAAAEATGRKVLFVLRQEVCRYCDELEMNVTHQPYFQDEISRNYVLSEINITRDQESANHFTVRQTPAVLVYDPKTKGWHNMLSVPRNIPAFLTMLKGM